jgi:hypothetical protein
MANAAAVEQERMRRFRDAALGPMSARGTKRTSQFAVVMSASDPWQTFALKRPAQIT